MKKILITGAPGFIGKAFLKLLKQNNFAVHAICRTQPQESKDIAVTWHTCDLLNPAQVSQTLQAIKPDFLIHLAWYVEHKLFWSSEKNLPFIAATAQLYKEFSLNGGEKAIFFGTCAEYDPTYSICNEETTPLKPRTLYGLAKKQTWELLQQLQKDNPHYAPFCWVRIFNVFGPHENLNRLVPYIFKSFLNKTRPVISSPYATRDHLFVENLAAIVIQLLTADLTGAINVGQGITMPIGELAELIHTRYFNNQPAAQFAATITPEDVLIPDLKKLMMKPQDNINDLISLENGLDQTFEWLTSTQPMTQDSTIG